MHSKGDAYLCAERGQRRLDFLAPRLVLVREPEGRAERGDRFVNSESGNIGGYLEKHAAGLLEVERAEVLAVLLVGGADAVVLGQLALQHERRFVVGSAKSDVVNR